eukprot:CAMPEP_0174900682 /NCGR_PEP_ID=MMETSP0167-20121228/32239_1 /TAXON_ID=38298 /ORGANISM="Rhodella maculata, Strain CCMP736" /LENGTH=78 /DNA_ID=CAMNT_0016142153 /DNA_START=166 /DNA_END=402 /DNA_ORIENTATION=+
MSSSPKFFVLALLLALLLAVASAAPAPRGAPAVVESALAASVAMPALKVRGGEMRAVRQEAAQEEKPKSPADLPAKDS